MGSLTLKTSKKIHRLEQIGRELMRRLQPAFYEMIPVEWGWVTITRVQVSGDLREAKVFYYIDPIHVTLVQAFLEENAYQFQNLLAREVNLRFTPKLRFIFDQRYQENLRVERFFFEQTQAAVKDSDIKDQSES